MDQPLGDPSLLPTWLLSEYASRHVPVVLTGEGGDELFAGYPTYLGHRHATLAARLPAPVSAAALALARRFRPRHHHVTIAHLLERFLNVRGLSRSSVIWRGSGRHVRARRWRCSRSGLRAAVTEHEPLGHARALDARLTDMGMLAPGASVPLTAYQLLDFETYLAGDLLTKVDRCTMAHGVESRAPFLRPSSIAHALGLPESLRLRGTSGKWVLEQAARGSCCRRTSSIAASRASRHRSRPGRRGPLRGLVVDALSPRRVARAGVLDPDAVQAVLREHLEAREDRGRLLWTLLALQAWADHWLVGQPDTTDSPTGLATR
jgi:asparagine synthase (glutamine-hydrolysing)